MNESVRGTIMLNNHLQHIYAYTPIKKWWHIWKRIKLYLLLKSAKRSIKHDLDNCSYDEFISLIPEFCSIMTDMKENKNFISHKVIYVSIIEYVINYYTTYILRIDDTDPKFGNFTISYNFNTREDSRLHFRLVLKNKSFKFSHYDGYIEKDSKFIISKDIKDQIIDHTKNIIYDTMCDILDTISNRYILRKEDNNYDKKELRDDS